MPWAVPPVASLACVAAVVVVWAVFAHGPGVWDRVWRRGRENATERLFRGNHEAGHYDPEA